MAKFNLYAPFEGCSGKLDKDDNLVFSQRYGTTYAWEVEPSKKEPTEEQMAHRARFATACTQATADMADPDKRAEWQEVAPTTRTVATRLLVALPLQVTMPMLNKKHGDTACHVPTIKH